MDKQAYTTAGCGCWNGFPAGNGGEHQRAHAGTAADPKGGASVAREHLGCFPPDSSQNMVKHYDGSYSANFIGNFRASVSSYACTSYQPRCSYVCSHCVRCMPWAICLSTLAHCPLRPVYITRIRLSVTDCCTVWMQHRMQSLYVHSGSSMASDHHTPRKATLHMQNARSVHKTPEI